MHEKYSEIKYYHEHCDLLSPLEMNQVEASLANLLQTRYLKISLSNRSCSNKKCWSILFQLLSLRKDSQQVCQLILEFKENSFKMSIINSLADNLISLQSLHKLTIILHFKNNFLPINSEQINQLIHSLNQNVVSLSIDILQETDPNAHDDQKVAHIIRAISSRPSTRRFSFKYETISNPFVSKACGKNNGDSLGFRSIVAFTQVLASTPLQKFKLHAFFCPDLFNNGQLGCFCAALRSCATLNHLSLLLDDKIVEKGVVFGPLENAWTDNPAISVLALRRLFNVERGKDKTITRISLNLRELKLIGFDYPFQRLPPSLESLSLPNGSILFFQIKVNTSSTHSLKRLVLSSPNMSTEFPEIIPLFFRKLEFLEIKTNVKNNRFLQYIKEDTHLGELRVNCFESQKDPCRILEFFETLDKAPHLRVLHLTFKQSPFTLSNNMFHSFGKFLSELHVVLEHLNFHFEKEVSAILNLLESNTMLVKLEIYFRSVMNSFLPTKRHFHIFNNDTLTHFHIHLPAHSNVSDSLILFQNKTIQRLSAIVSFLAFEKFIMQYIPLNPFQVFNDLLL